MSHNVHASSTAVLDVPVIGPAETFETVTEAVAQIPLASRTPLPWVAIFLTALGLFGPNDDGNADSCQRNAYVVQNE